MWTGLIRHQSQRFGRLGEMIIDGSQFRNTFQPSFNVPSLHLFPNGAIWVSLERRYSGSKLLGRSSVPFEWNILSQPVPVSQKSTLPTAR